MKALFSNFNQSNIIGLLLNVTIAVTLCLAINGVIFGLGWDSTDTSNPVWFAPQGYFIPVVWIILFAFIGIARFLLNASGEVANNTKKLLVFLLVFCLAYPIYTIGLSSEIIGFFGNLATIALTIFVITRTWQFSKLATTLLVPIVAWVCFATLIVMAEIGWI